MVAPCGARLRKNPRISRNGQQLGDFRAVQADGGCGCYRFRCQRRYCRRRERHISLRAGLGRAAVRGDAPAPYLAQWRDSNVVFRRGAGSLRGPQHDGALLDELASWRNPATFDMLMFGLRLGQHPRTIIATTPRPTKLVRQILAREGHDVVITRGSTYENAPNLAPAFFTQIVSRYEGTRLGRQELNAEVLMDVPGALWSLDQIDSARREHAPDLARVVVAIDPAVSSKEGNDETGIIVAGRDEKGHGYVIEDLSGRYDPAGWARTAINAYWRHSADRIVAETNQGGDMVENTIRTIDENVSYSAVHASRGKFIRAEPIAALYEQSRVHHVGSFPELEDQMSSFVADIDRAKLGSPDRVDALVWGLTELMLERMPYAGLFEYYRERAAEVALAK